MDPGGARVTARWACFRFYEELNDFLPAERRKRAFDYRFDGTPAIKDAIEAIGVPHTEVDLILIDGESRGFDHLLRGGERVAVYPVFERFDIADAQRLRPRPLRHSRFVLDVHLGQLARRLRLLGLDAEYRNDYEDPEIVRISVAERRTILTCDKGLLKHKIVQRGHWVRARDPDEQTIEVIRAFDLERALDPFSRCLECNGALRPAAHEAARGRVPDEVAEAFDAFHECPDCGRIYWPGSHYDRLRRRVAALLANGSDDARARAGQPTASVIRPRGRPCG